MTWRALAEMIGWCSGSTGADQRPWTEPSRGRASRWPRRRFTLSRKICLAEAGSRFQAGMRSQAGVADADGGEVEDRGELSP